MQKQNMLHVRQLVIWDIMFVIFHIVEHCSFHDVIKSVNEKDLKKQNLNFSKGVLKESILKLTAKIQCHCNYWKCTNKQL